MTSRCRLCPHVNACIPPDGPLTRGGVLCIGEAPGYDEDKQAKKSPPGKPFIGKTGEEVNSHYLALAGLRRAGVDFTNAIACLPDRPKGKLDPTHAPDLALLEACATHHLYPLIERLRPRALVPLGQFACRAIFGEAFDLELRHGLPTTSPWGIPTFPQYHPALGLHEPKKMLYVRTDWHRLGQFLAGTLFRPVDDYPTPDYAEVTDEDEIQDIELDRPVACDTESGRAGPFCFTFSQWPGRGRLIKSDRPDLLRALDARLQAMSSAILFHHWLYDWPITEAMGLQLPYHRIVDTMARVFHLGNLPQGLKALSLRELGMEMEDFEDVVKPYSTQRVLEYYRLAYAEDWPKPPLQYVESESGGVKEYQPQSMSTKLKRFFTDYTKAPLTKDVFGAWENWTDAHDSIEARLGPWPGMDIEHVPFEKTLHYACRDVDALIRLWPVLRKMATLTRRFSQEHWRERAA